MGKNTTVKKSQEKVIQGILKKTLEALSKPNVKKIGGPQKRLDLIKSKKFLPKGVPVQRG